MFLFQVGSSSSPVPNSVPGSMEGRNSNKLRIFAWEQVKNIMLASDEREIKRRRQGRLQECFQGGINFAYLPPPIHVPSGELINILYCKKLLTSIRSYNELVSMQLIILMNIESGLLRMHY